MILKLLKFQKNWYMLPKFLKNGYMLPKFQKMGTSTIMKSFQFFFINSSDANMTPCKNFIIKFGVDDSIC